MNSQPLGPSLTPPPLLNDVRGRTQLPACWTTCSGSYEDQHFSQSFPGWKQRHLVSMLRVLVVLVVSRVVGGQWGSVYPRVVEGTVALVPAASFHHEVTTHRPLGHVWHTEQNENHTAVGSSFITSFTLSVVFLTPLYVSEIIFYFFIINITTDCFYLTDSWYLSLYTLTYCGTERPRHAVVLK